MIDQDRRVVVGATFVGASVSELLHSATIAVVDGGPDRPPVARRAGVPMVSEVWLRLLEQDRKLDRDS